MSGAVLPTLTAPAAVQARSPRASDGLTAPSEPASVPDVFHQPHGADVGAVDVAHGDGRDASAALERVAFSAGSGINAVINPSHALPTARRLRNEALVLRRST
jgi:hypothetical protein